MDSNNEDIFSSWKTENNNLLAFNTNKWCFKGDKSGNKDCRSVNKIHSKEIGASFSIKEEDCHILCESKQNNIHVQEEAAKNSESSHRVIRKNVVNDYGHSDTVLENLFSSEDSSEYEYNARCEGDLEKDNKKRITSTPCKLKERNVKVPRGSRMKMKRVYGERVIYHGVYEVPHFPLMKELKFNELESIPYHVDIDHPIHYERPLFQQIREVLCKRNAMGYRASFINHENQFFVTEIIKNSVLTGNWKRLSVALLCLCYNAKYCAEMLWKVGSEILTSHSFGRQHLESFHNMMKLLGFYNFQPEVVMDYALTLLSENKLHEAYQVATGVVEKFSTNIYFSVFYGLLEYSLWKIEFNHIKAAKPSKKNWLGEWGNEDDDENNSDDDHCNDLADNNNLSENTSLAFHGRRAIKNLEKVEEIVGVWDCILPKYMELLSFYRGKDGVVQALEAHIQNNPENPYSYNFYLHYLKEAPNEKNVFYEMLERLCTIDPTNDWGKELLDHYKNTKCYKELLSLLIKRLDHQACSDSYFDWNLLLMTLRNKLYDIKIFFEETAGKYPSWVKYHFPVPLNVFNQSLSKDVLVVKLKIADYLNIDHYSSCVDEWFQRNTIKYRSVFTKGEPDTVNLSLKLGYELSDPFDELASVSSPEMIFSDNFNESDDDLGEIRESDIEGNVDAQCGKRKFDDIATSGSCLSGSDNEKLMTVKKMKLFDRERQGSFSSSDSSDNIPLATIARRGFKKRNYLKAAIKKVADKGYVTVSPVSSSSSDDDSL